MFGIGTGELLLLLFLALLVLGPERMPRLARDIGRTVGDLRRTSDELREEFLNADRLLERAAETPASDASAAPAQPIEPPSLPEAADAATAAPPDAGATQGDVVASPVAGDHDETDFDREARLARERLESPERQARAKAEGWPIPTDDAGGNTDRWG